MSILLKRLKSWFGRANPFPRFTEAAIKVVMLAQEEALRLDHHYVGTEHLLLGMIGEDKGIAARSLKEQGVTIKEARQQAEIITGRGSGARSVQLPFTPKSKRVLEMAWDEARKLDHNYVSTEHLLLALICEGQGVGERILYNLGVDQEALRDSVLKAVAAES